MSAVRMRLALCCSYSCSVLSPFVIQKYTTHPCVSSAHCCQSLFTLQKSLDNTTDWTERERAKNKPELNLGTTVQMLLSNPTFLNGRDLSLVSLLSLSLLVSSFLPCRFLSVSLSHFPLCQRNLPSSWECSFNLEILPCLWSLWDSAQGRAWLLLLQLSNIHYCIFITLRGVECIMLQLGSQCGIYAFYPFPLKWLGHENIHMHERTHVPSATTAERSCFIVFSHWQHI